MAQTVKVIIGEDGGRLDKVLAALLPEFTRTRIQKLIEDGCVSIEGRECGKKTVVSSGECISIELPETKETTVEAEDIPLDIFYEDDDLLVVNKPKGMVVHPAAGNPNGTLVNALLAHCRGSLSGIGGVARPGIVHRIDKDTSGLLIVAKNDFTHLRLAELIKAHDFTRQYEAIVTGCPREERGRVCAPIGRSKNDRKKMAVVAQGGREAVTNYEVLERYRGCSRVRLTLETGRTHQIRVHMAYIGHPVVCDTVYGSSKPRFACCSGQCLHAERIAFVHPRTGERIDITAPLPKYFTDIIERLREE